MANAKERMFTLGLTGGVWDKKSTRMYGIRTTLRDRRVLEYALGQRLRLWGWRKDRHHASRVVIEHSIKCVREQGMLKDMLGHRIGSRHLKSHTEAKKWLDDTVPLAPSVGHRPLVKAPSLAIIPK